MDSYCLAPVTTRQVEVLRAIARLREQMGIPPTVRELAGDLGIASTQGITDHLRALEKKGLIERRPLVSRGLFLTTAGRQLLGQQGETP